MSQKATVLRLLHQYTSPYTSRTPVHQIVHHFCKRYGDLWWFTAFAPLEKDLKIREKRVMASNVWSASTFPTMKVKGAQKVNSDAAAEKAEGPADFECACNTCPSQEACKAAQEAASAANVGEKTNW